MRGPTPKADQVRALRESRESRRSLVNPRTLPSKAEIERIADAAAKRSEKAKKDRK